MLKYLTYISFLVIFVRLNAQDTTAVDSTLNDTNKVTKKFNITTRGNFSRGNVNRELFVASTSYSINAFKKDFDASLAYTYGSQDKSLREDEIDFNVAAKFFKDKPTYFIAFGEVHRSFKRKIDYQHGLGLGLGKYLIRKDSSKLSVSLAFLNQITDYSTFKDVHLHRMSLRISGKHYIRNSYLKYVIWFQPAIEQNTFRSDSIIEYNIPLTRTLVFNITYVIEYDDLILEEDVEALDSRILFGLKFNINKDKWI